MYVLEKEVVFKERMGQLLKKKLSNTEITNSFIWDCRRVYKLQSDNFYS